MPCLVCGWLLLLAPLALAQNAAPPPVPPAPIPAAPVEQAPAEKSGMFEAIGRWFDRGAANFRDSLRGAKRRIDEVGDKAAANSRDLGDKAAEAGKSAVDVTKGAVDVTKSAVDTVVKLPATRVMKGRERCALAPNGAPDCVAAAEALCRKHGFASGQSMDFTSAEECPAKALIGQQSRAECTTVTFISRAMCQ